MGLIDLHFILQHIDIYPEYAVLALPTSHLNSQGIALSQYDSKETVTC